MEYEDEPPPVTCVLGGHRHSGAGRLCTGHLDELADLIRGVARMTHRLGQHLMPASSSPLGEKVSTSRTGSPPPLYFAALNLAGPGGRDVRRDPRNLAPLVRRWSTVSTYDVTVAGRTVRRQLRDWHSEVVTAGGAPPRTCRCGRPHDGDTVPSGTTVGRPVLRMLDDQAGAIPPAEWMDEHVRAWRLALQHGARTLPAGQWVDYGETDQDKRLTRAGLGETMRAAAGRPAALLCVAAFIALRREWDAARRQIRPALLGLHTDGTTHQHRAAAAVGSASARVWDDAAAGTLTRPEDALTGSRPPSVAHDPVTAEWVLRYGAAKTAAAVEVDAHYLTRWLPAIALLPDDDGQGDGVDLDGFAVELRALHAELQHVLGEARRETWIGRCPTHLVDSDGQDTDRLCGAGLWHDPHRLGWRIQCPRCHSSWPETQWLTLAAQIRSRWPIDTRRRYTTADRRAAELAAAMPTCHGCDKTMAVQWRYTPERGDTETWWRPIRLHCPAGCLAGGTTAAA